MPQMSFELFVALRYLFSRRKQTFIYIISIMSILGVAIGVGALVVVLGVYNGLTTDMRDKNPRGQCPRHCHVLHPLGL